MPSSDKPFVLSTVFGPPWPSLLSSVGSDGTLQRAVQQLLATTAHMADIHCCAAVLRAPRVLPILPSTTPQETQSRSQPPTRPGRLGADAGVYWLDTPACDCGGNREEGDGSGGAGGCRAAVSDGHLAPSAIVALRSGTAWLWSVDLLGDAVVLQSVTSAVPRFDIHVALRGQSADAVVTAAVGAGAVCDCRRGVQHGSDDGCAVVALTQSGPEWRASYTLALSVSELTHRRKVDATDGVYFVSVCVAASAQLTATPLANVTVAW